MIPALHASTHARPRPPRAGHRCPATPMLNAGDDVAARPAGSAGVPPALPNVRVIGRRVARRRSTAGSIRHPVAAASRRRMLSSIRMLDDLEKVDWSPQVERDCYDAVRDGVPALVDLLADSDAGVRQARRSSQARDRGPWSETPRPLGSGWRGGRAAGMRPPRRRLGSERSAGQAEAPLLADPGFETLVRGTGRLSLRAAGSHIRVGTVVEKTVAVVAVEGTNDA